MQGADGKKPFIRVLGQTADARFDCDGALIAVQPHGEKMLIVRGSLSTFPGASEAYLARAADGTVDSPLSLDPVRAAKMASYADHADSL